VACMVSQLGEADDDTVNSFNFEKFNTAKNK
jgi:hypothetical protein